MCQAKPGPRCKGDTARLLDVRRHQYALALGELAEHGPNEKVARAAQGLWLARLEAAGADPSSAGRSGDATWMRNAGEALAQARAEQAALMPPKPSDEAPARLRDAYNTLASMRDDLARADAIATADALVPDSPSVPHHGDRPDYTHIDERVAAAEYAFTAAANGPDEISGWRHLMTKGQMPYDPFNFADHPALSMSAPWTPHHRPATPVDVHTVERASGFTQDVSWDAQRKAVVVHADRDGYLDEDELEYTVNGLERSLWQLGFHTERADGARVVISRCPDLAKWRSGAFGATKKRAA